MSWFVMKEGATVSHFYDSIEDGRVNTVSRGRAPEFSEDFAKTIVKQLTGLGHAGFRAVHSSELLKKKRV